MHRSTFSFVVAALLVTGSAPALAEEAEKEKGYCAAKEWAVGECRIGIFVLGGAAVKGQYGQTDASGRNGEFTQPIPVSFDKEEEVGSISVGWFEKPLLRDTMIALGFRDAYEDAGLVRKLILDPITVDLHYGYSRKFDFEEAHAMSGEFQYTNDFTATVQYSLPLDDLFLGSAYGD